MTVAHIAAPALLCAPIKSDPGDRANGPRVMDHEEEPLMDSTDRTVPCADRCGGVKDAR